MCSCVRKKKKKKKRMVSASEIATKFNLASHPEGGFFSETFRDSSVMLSTSQLPPQCKHFVYMPYLFFFFTFDCDVVTSASVN